MDLTGHENFYSQYEYIFKSIVDSRAFLHEEILEDYYENYPYKVLNHVFKKMSKEKKINNFCKTSEFDEKSHMNE